MASFDDGSTAAVEIYDAVFAVVHSELPSCYYEDTCFHVRDVCCSADGAAD